MADGSVTRKAVQGASVDVAVVGAGFAGLYMVHKAREAGLSVQGFEAVPRGRPGAHVRRVKPRPLCTGKRERVCVGEREKEKKRKEKGK
jgi:nucleoside-diphosphate-sugar epimerase